MVSHLEESVGLVTGADHGSVDGRNRSGKLTVVTRAFETGMLIT